MASPEPIAPSPADAEPGFVLDAVIEISDDAVFVLDRRGRIAEWNRAAERYVGFEPAEMRGEAMVALFPDHLRSDLAAVLQRVDAGDSVRHHETELLRQDGMPMPVSVSLAPVVAADRVPLGTVLVVRDITEQRLAQAALAEVEGRVRESEALAHVGSWLWDLRTGAVQWSDEFHRIHGLDPAAFDGTLDGHLAIIHDDDRERVRSSLEVSGATGRPFGDEYRIVRPDGATREIRARAHPMHDSSGAVVGLRGIGQDLTEPFVPGSRPGS